MDVMARQAVLLGLQGTFGHPALELFNGLAADGELDEMKRHDSGAGWRQALAAVSYPPSAPPAQAAPEPVHGFSAPAAFWVRPPRLPTAARAAVRSPSTAASAVPGLSARGS